MRTFTIHKQKPIMTTQIKNNWSIFESAPKPGPFPLRIMNCEDRYIAVTNHGSHYATTYDPAAAKAICALPDLLQALEDFVLLADLEDNFGPVANNAREALRKAKGGLL